MCLGMYISYIPVMLRSTGFAPLRNSSYSPSRSNVKSTTERTPEQQISPASNSAQASTFDVSGLPSWHARQESHAIAWAPPVSTLAHCLTVIHPSDSFRMRWPQRCRCLPWSIGPWSTQDSSGNCKLRTFALWPSNLWHWLHDHRFDTRDHG